MLYLLLYLLIVTPLAWVHDTIPKYLGQSFSKSFFSNTQTETYWTIVDRVHRRRAYILALLISITLSVFVLSFIALDLIDELYGFTTNEYLLYIIIALCLSYGVEEILDRKRVLTDHASHPDRIKVQRIIETLSVTAGIAAPQLIFYAGSTPKLFLQVPAIGHPRINVSTSFLQFFNETEAEAYIAHEIGHYLSNEARTQRTFEMLFTLLKISGLILFMSLLALIHHTLPFIWVGAYVSIAVRTILEKNELRHAFRNIHVLFLIMNPVHLLAVLLSSFIHFTMNYGEMVYADLKGIELTRYPQGLYSALLKVMNLVGDESYQNFWFALPSSSNAIAKHDESFAEHLIRERLRLIKNFDVAVTETYSPIPTLMCSVCGNKLVDTPIPGTHEVITHVWACHSCANIWFDKGSFNSLSGADTKDSFKTLPTSGEHGNLRKPPFSCPRCNTQLSLLHDKAYPKELSIFHCSSCRGILASTADFITYTQHRLSLIKMKSLWKHSSQLE